ncbi:UDP-N-acetylmuramoyl-tripeptide--D-alanyl-D-alanine ligase [Acidocella aromatica]|uniref:UDP-N-acetylmuramoyl-tripeptide--D-alanyl-D-alanine ligase n=1 Tax=Acidocella aromatica TaxID=1303579 RepID=A0A840VK87_9PROT|nr:UDP-N-acetylmuramoyl-tripeptide--D-alanyl-D-alanine ligase [Acidocella aromatica]MBB5371920.1 UDP-N-acetylmuramoyl-tripeptide--D-alanyl-D-alanine ligase [Acidocella aromatica]
MSLLWRAEELTHLFGQGFDVSGISIDTRTLQPGDLFVALAGERDGHDFVEAAFAKGAAAALVSREMAGNTILVGDTLKALERLGAAARARSAAKIVAVTGSVGKTTTKEMLRRTLGAFGAVHAAEASFNNHIGVPLTLARMPEDADFGVFEIGMNHSGEIAPLVALVRPHVAVVTCVDRAHLGLMGSEEAIAREKAAIYGGLEPGGTAVIPGDSAYLGLLLDSVPEGRLKIVCGREAWLRDVKAGPEGSEIQAEISGVTVRFTLLAPGLHMARNAVATLAAAVALGLDAHQAAAGLDGFAPFAGRGARRELLLPEGGSVLLLDESYNASGASMRAALAVLELQPGRHVAVLGDMLELGEHAEAEHLALLPALIQGADLVFACGTQSKALFDSLPLAKQGAHAPDAATLAPLVKAALRAGDTVLVKGSYGSRMRDVISHLESPG